MRRTCELRLGFLPIVTSCAVCYAEQRKSNYPQLGLHWNSLVGSPHISWPRLGVTCKLANYTIEYVLPPIRQNTIDFSTTELHNDLATALTRANEVQPMPQNALTFECD